MEIEEIKRKKLSILVIIAIVLVLLAILITIYFLKDIIFVKCDYVYLNNRTSYQINIADENFLNKYYGNKKTMVIFMASWCKYCNEEKDALNEFIQNNPDKKIIVVSHDKNYDDINNFLKENNFNWFVILDKDKTIRNNIDPGANGIPSAYLLDRRGNIIGYKRGELTKDEFLPFYNNEINIYNQVNIY